MSQAASIAVAVVDREDLAVPAMASAEVSLKGTTRGLEIQVASAPTADALADRLSELLAEAPSFFAGSDARVAFETALPVGALARLEEVAAQFALNLVEIGPVAKRARSYAAIVRRVDEARGKLAEGTGPIAEREKAHMAVDAASAPAEASALGDADAAMDDAPEIVIEAAPIEIELANTAPYLIQDPVAKPAEAAEIEAALACAESLAAPATQAAAASSRDDAILALAEELANELAAELAVKLAEPIAQARAEELAQARAAELVEARAKELAQAMAAQLAETRAVELAKALAPDLAEPIAHARAQALADQLADAKLQQLLAAQPAGMRLVIGPVRSGVIVDHTGTVLVIGDVNPGAEVRAHGSIIVLGRLRGVAHAAIGREAGCIVALSLQPQQLRIGRMVARAGANDRPSDSAEIAYLTGETIVVERFSGRLPSGLAASI